MNDKLHCPIKKYVREDRLKILLYNAITIFNEHLIDYMDKDEKIKFLKEEIGFTDNELSDLGLEEYLAK